MASASAVLEEIGQDFLECGICIERYTNPKILDCVHSFCEKCLVNYYGNHEVKPCPVCRQETRLPVPGGISGLKTNGFLTTLRDKVELQEKVAQKSDKSRRSCELCSENEVTHHCLNCSQNICQSCMNIHQRIKGMADHTVGTLEDIRRGKVTLPEVQKEYTCNKHKGEINRFYCETCQILICRDCTVVDHCKPEHQYIDRAAASTKYKKILKELFPTLTNEIKQFKGCLKGARTARQQFEKKFSHTKQEVKKGADRLRAKVKAEEGRILGEMRVLKEDRNTALEEHIKSLKSVLQRKQHTLTVARDVTTKGSDSDFLSIFPIINQDLTFLRNQVPPKIDANFQYRRLDQTGSIRLGKLDVGYSNWELSREVDGKGTVLNLQSVSSIAALKGDKLAVTSARQLIIFNTAGGIEQTIQTEGDSCCTSSFHYHLVVVNDKYVQIYNEDFTFRDIVPYKERSGRTVFGQNEDHHKCICIKKDGTILVGHPDERVIRILHRNGQLIEVTRLSLKKTPQFLATDSNDRVLVTSYNDNRVTVIDDQGGTLLAIKPTINGEPVKYCSGVCCDGSDIYVAVGNSEWCSGQGHRHRGGAVNPAYRGTDTRYDGGEMNRFYRVTDPRYDGGEMNRFYQGSGPRYDGGEMNRGPVSSHIHRYDGDGMFLSCIVQGLHQPSGITLTEDGQHLAVVDNAKVKIYHKV